MLKLFIISVSLLSFFSNCFAEETQVQTRLGTDIPVSIYKTENAHSVLLWIPSEHGLHGPENATALALAQRGVEVWIADLHGAYFIPSGRRSYNNIVTTEIVDLILASSKNSKREVTLFATGRAAVIALKAARELQKNIKTRHIINSAVLFHPNFYISSTQVGKNVEYFAITSATNLALYIVQPALSGKSYQINTLQKKLQQGGSDVITQILPGVADGFNIRQPDNKTEEAFYRKTPSIINNAIKLLKSYKKTRTASAFAETNTINTAATITTGLQVYQGNIKQPFLNFKDLNNTPHTFKNHKGEVLLLNFWASWCPPCVKELPSLNRLQEKINNKNFNILAINIGEETETVKKFLAPMTIKFPVLTDPEGTSVSPWNLVAFPSSFVIDKTGKIRYGLFGGLEWDNEQVTTIIKKLLSEQ